MKPGIKTTEFWVSVVVGFIGLLASAGVFTPDQASTLTEALTKLGGLVVMVASAFGYSISRGAAKKHGEQKKDGGE